jgi:hypothetical protein
MALNVVGEFIGGSAKEGNVVHYAKKRRRIDGQKLRPAQSAQTEK